MTAHGIKLRTPAIREFCRKWKIRELNVFGSILRDDFRPDSDIDFLAVFDEDETWDLFDEFAMQDELADIVRRRVNLLSREGLEFSDNRFFKREVYATAERIYAA